MMLIEEDIAAHRERWGCVNNPHGATNRRLVLSWLCSQKVTWKIVPESPKCLLVVYGLCIPRGGSLSLHDVHGFVLGIIVCYTVSLA